MLRVLFDRYDSAKTFTTILSCLGVFFYSGSTASFIGCATASPISQQDKQLSEGTHTVMSRDGSPYPAKIEVEAEEIPEIIALPEKKLSIDLSSLERSKGLQSSEVIGVFPIPLSSGQQLVSTAMKDGEIIGKSASSESGASYKLASLGAGISQIDYSLAEGLFGYLKGSELSVYSLQEGRKIISNRKLNTRIKSLKFQIDGKSLFVGAADGMIYEWKFADEIKQSRKHEEEYLQRYTGASSVINAIAMHREGRLFFTGDWNGDLIAWRTFDSDQRGGFFDRDYAGKPFVTRKALKKQGRDGNGIGIEQIVVGARGQYVFIALKDGTVEVWRIKGFDKLATVQATRGLITGLDVVEGEPTVAVAGRDGKVVVFTLVEKEELVEKLVPPRYGEGPSNLVKKLETKYSLDPVQSFTIPGVKSLRFTTAQTLFAGVGKGGIKQLNINKTTNS